MNFCASLQSHDSRRTDVCSMEPHPDLRGTPRRKPSGRASTSKCRPRSPWSQISPSIDTLPLNLSFFASFFLDFDMSRTQPRALAAPESICVNCMPAGPLYGAAPLVHPLRHPDRSFLPALVRPSFPSASDVYANRKCIQSFCYVSLYYSSTVGLIPSGEHKHGLPQSAEPEVFRVITVCWLSSEKATNAWVR